MAYKVKHIHCPVNGWDCPYYTDHKHPCRCTLENPMKDCDDFASMWDEDDDYIDDDWVEEKKKIIKVETTAKVVTTCYLTDEDAEKVRAFMKENVCDLEDAVKELFWNNELDIYTHSTESDFSTESIDLVEEGE